MKVIYKLLKARFHIYKQTKENHKSVYSDFSKLSSFHQKNSSLYKKQYVKPAD